MSDIRFIFCFRREDAGEILADVMRQIMDTMKIENGLSELGYTEASERLDFHKWMQSYFHTTLHPIIVR